MSATVEEVAPHGPVREILEAIIDGKRVIVKRNFGGEGVSVEAVSQNRAAFLKAVTVMAKREDGYDPEDANWVKYKLDGSLHTNAKRMKLAGKVAKSMDKGCIACLFMFGALRFLSLKYILLSVRLLSKQASCYYLRHFKTA